MYFKLFTLLTFIMLSGCAVVPESIQVADDNQLIDYPQVSANPDGNIDKTARWGGVIANVQNLPDATMLEMVYYPLRAYGRPNTNEESVGRFRVYVDGFLDPMVYEKGRSITFTGQVLGSEEGSVGEHVYRFPSLKAQGYYLWRNVHRVEVTGVHFWPYYPFYNFHHYPYHRRVIVSGGYPHKGVNRSSSTASRSSVSRSRSDGSVRQKER